MLNTQQQNLLKQVSQRICHRYTETKLTATAWYRQNENIGDMIWAIENLNIPFDRARRVVFETRIGMSE
jgi:hypothetical protein